MVFAKVGSLSFEVSWLCKEAGYKDPGSAYKLDQNSEQILSD